MRAVIQRVTFAKVEVEKNIVGQINQGVLILLAIAQNDTEEQAKKLAQKIAELRIFSDAEEKMNLSLLDVNGSALVVSQFTLYADCTRGRRPYFGEAALPQVAEPLCKIFVESLKQAGVKDVPTGKFGAHMQVELCNDGPVTILLDA